MEGSEVCRTSLQSSMPLGHFFDIGERSTKGDEPSAAIRWRTSSFDFGHFELLSSCPASDSDDEPSLALKILGSDVCDAGDEEAEVEGEPEM